MLLSTRLLAMISATNLILGLCGDTIRVPAAPSRTRPDAEYSKRHRKSELVTDRKRRRVNMFAIEAERIRNEAILAARVLLVLLFVIFGWSKLTDYGGTVGYMAMTGAPAPQISAAVAIAIELFVGIAILLGVFTRQLALVMAVYALATAFIGHHYWTMSGTDQFANEIDFYKNVSITGGFLLLCITGAGKYSLDATFEERSSHAQRQMN
jgi:putative oxidoreductase